MSGQPAVLQVVILRDGLLVGTEVFSPGAYTLGSAPTADLKLDDPAVNPQHAVLYFQNGKVAVQDRASGTGIYVNGHKVTACEVRSVDEISCGPFVLKTRVLAQKPAPKGNTPPEVAALLKGTPPPNPAPPARAPAVPRPAVAAPALPVARGRPQGASPAPPAMPAAKNRAPPAIPGKPSAAPAGTQLSARRVQGSVEPAVPAHHKNGVHRAAPPFSRPEPPPSRDENVIISGQLFDAPEPKRKPAAAPARFAPASRRSPRPVHVPSIRADAKGAPRLYLELYWGDIRREARSFRIDKKKPVIAGATESAPMPLWGFSLSEEPYVLAESASNGFRLYVPPRSAADKKKGDAFHSLGPRELESEGSRRFISMTKGAAARLTEGQMTLVAYVATKPARVWVNPFRGLPWLAMFFFALFSSGLASFVLFGPKPPETPDFTGKNLPPVAVRLLAPQPKKKEEAKKKLEALKEEAKKKEEVKEEKKEEKKKVVKEKVREPPKQKVVVDPPPPPPETKALKALAKLSAAGPATGDILAAVDKLGAGPGSKNVKNNYKLSGLIGKAPIANAGLGTFGLGGGGRGGAGMLGAEILHGKGGGGIGAMGAGGVGRGAVGGTVTRASARNVSVQGSIDREAVAKVVNAHLQEVRGCYERALLREPALAGKVVLEWTISLAGKVVSSRTKSSTLKNSAVEACILQSLNLWQFPPAKGGVVIVSYPFLFNSVGY